MSHKKILLILFIILVGTFLIACSSGSSKDNSNSDTIDTGTEDGTDPDPDPTPGPNPEPTHVIGWTESTPTPFDTSSHTLTHIEQPGSRIFYLSTDGDDSTAVIYFWDGTNIVDSSGSLTGEGGVAYGTDPMNPTGPINPFRRWSYVAPRWTESLDIGSPWDGVNYTVPGGYTPIMRYEYPDWWLFKRGDTFNLHEDFLSFAQESDPGLTSVSHGSLAVSGGRSESERQIVGAYGDLTSPRPILINPPVGYFISRMAEPDPKHIAYLSLHFDGRTDQRGGGINFYGQTNAAVDILIEDLWIDGTLGNIVQNTSADITIRRSLLTDTYKDDGSHISGIFYAGSSDAIFRFEQSIILRNGFSEGDPQATGWPPPAGGQYWNVYNRNLYLSGECNNMESGLFDSVSMLGASGDQFRSGMRVERNFFYQGYVEMGAHGGYPDSRGPTGTMYDNVLQRFQASGASDNRGQPGWGFQLTSGAYQVEVARNIVTGVQYAANDYGFFLDALLWYCYSDTFHYATRQNRIYDNIFDTANASAAIKVGDGIYDEETPDCAGWTYRGVTGNEFSTNVLINGNNAEYEYVPVGEAVGTTNDTVYTDNRIYTNRSSAATAEGWNNPDRTLRSYMESLGHTVTSDDGFIEYFNQAIQMRRGNWHTEYTARALVNYFKQGFGMELLEVDE